MPNYAVKGNILHINITNPEEKEILRRWKLAVINAGEAIKERIISLIQIDLNRMRRQDGI